MKDKKPPTNTTYLVQNTDEDKEIIDRSWSGVRVVEPGEMTTKNFDKKESGSTKKQTATVFSSRVTT